ncbi:MAG: TlpA disulfide reductase family protein [Rhodospirillales bacterium]
MPDTTSNLIAATVAVAVVAGWLAQGDDTQSIKAIAKQESAQAEACSHANALDAGLRDYLPKSPPKAIADAEFQDGDGHPVSIADFRGRGVVINFWATWCAPCVAEMPALDRADAALARDGIRVVAISEDRKPGETIEAFFAEHGLTSLERYWDDGMSFARAAGIGALPTTLLVDARGREVAAVLGAAEWDQPAVIEFLRRCLAADG